MKTLNVFLVIVIISTTICDAKPNKSENNSEKQLEVRFERKRSIFREPLPFIGTSTALSLGNKLQRHGFGILVGPMLRILNLLHKIHLWLK